MDTESMGIAWVLMHNSNTVKYEMHACKVIMKEKLKSNLNSLDPEQTKKFLNRPRNS
jgi:hypothetical protein